MFALLLWKASYFYKDWIEDRNTYILTFTWVDFKRELNWIEKDVAEIVAKKNWIPYNGFGAKYWIEFEFFL